MKKMKIPKTFLTEKNVEKNIERLLNYVPPNADSFNHKYMYGDGIRLLEVESEMSEPVFSFDESLQRLKFYGYERHLRPWEYFDLVMGYLENSLEEKPNRAIKNIMEKNSCLWLSMAVEKKDNRLLCYIDPENLVWDESKKIYVVDGKLKYSDVGNFTLIDLQNIPAGRWVQSKELGEWFTTLIYQRKFEQLPKEMKEGGEGAFVYTPVDEGIWPVCVGRYTFKYSIDLYAIHPAASLGIRNKKN